MANQPPIRPRERSGNPVMGQNPDQLPLELSQQCRQAEDTCEELTEEQEHAPQWVPSRAGNLRREQVAMWLFIVAVIIISLPVGLPKPKMLPAVRNY
jgi:hypothetical protein